MGESRRVQRVEKELHQIISQFILTGLRDPLPGFVTISRVEASKDLRSAKVYVSEMMPSDDKDSVVETLQSQAIDMQKEIARQLPMKHCPKIRFYYDRGFEKGLKVERILYDIAQQRGDEE